MPFTITVRRPAARQILTWALGVLGVALLAYLAVALVDPTLSFADDAKNNGLTRAADHAKSTVQTIATSGVAIGAVAFTLWSLLEQKWGRMLGGIVIVGVAGVLATDGGVKTITDAFTKIIG